MTRTILDACGLQCPLPVLRTNKLLRTLAPGDEVEVIASDPAAPKDFASFCATTGHTLVSSETHDARFVIVLRKSG